MSESELARRSGQSPQNLHNKMTRGSFKPADLEKVAEALNADLLIKFIDKETGEPII